MTHEERFGTIVWNAIQDLTQEAIERGMTFIIIPSHVAKRAGVSRATASKYLEKMVVMGTAVHCAVGGRLGYMLIGGKNNE